MTKVLIVDDEPDLLKFLQAELGQAGFDTLLAGDGETAVKRVRMEKPDFVLLDIMMPVLDGWEVLRQVKQGPKPPVVIVMSAKAGEMDQEKGRDLGADAYITKPFYVEDIVATIRSFEERQRI